MAKPWARIQRAYSPWMHFFSIIVLIGQLLRMVHSGRLPRLWLCSLAHDIVMGGIKNGGMKNGGMKNGRNDKMVEFEITN